MLFAAIFRQHNARAILTLPLTEQSALRSSATIWKQLSLRSSVIYDLRSAIVCDRLRSPGGFYTGRLHPEVQPLTLLYTIFSEKAPLSYAFCWKKVPLSFTFLRRLLNKSLKQEVFCHFFHVARNKLK